jgi:magnesium transporter
MPRRFKSKSKKIGLPPGSLQYLGESIPEAVGVQLIRYNASDLREIDPCKSVEKINLKDEPDKAHWLNLHGVHDAELVGRVGKQFGIHPLALEDILDTEQRPKIEEGKDYLFITLKSLALLPDKSVNIEQISFVLFSNLVISFQEKSFDIFEPIRLRLRENRGLIRQKKADYLLYALLDMVVDNYFRVTEHLEEGIENLEAEVLRDVSSDHLMQIESLKKDIIFSRSAVLPFRDAVQKLEKGFIPHLDPANKRYFEDLKDNTFDTLEALDTSRQLVDSLLNLFINIRSNQMNEVMKVLTIIATIFIPLTFVSGIYGMNFKYMPELEWQWSYPLVWIAFIVLSVGMLFYFRRKKWL